MEFDFSKPIADVNTIPAEFRPMYVEKDGAHVLSDTFQPVAGAVTGLNKALKAARDEATAAKKGAVDLSSLAEFGATPAEIKVAFDARVAELTTKGGDATKAVERVRAEMALANTAAVEKEKGRSTALQNQLYTHLVRGAATEAIAAAKGVPELLLPFIEKQVKVVDNDGAFTPIVVDDKGEQRFSGVTGLPMSIKELVSEMKGDAARYGRLFDSDNQTGGTGTKPGATKTAASTGKEVKTSAQKIAAGLAGLARR